MPSIDEVVDRVSRAAFGRPLVTNVLRGQVVEAIVALALEPEWTWCAGDYASWDFECADGLRLEVKQSAARQSWAAPEHEGHTQLRHQGANRSLGRRNLHA